MSDSQSTHRRNGAVSRAFVKRERDITGIDARSIDRESIDFIHGGAMSTIHYGGVIHDFEIRVDNLLTEAAEIEARACEQIASADAEWARYSEIYRGAVGFDGKTRGFAITVMELCRDRIRFQRGNLATAARLIDEALEVERAGREAWGLA